MSLMGSPSGCKAAAAEIPRVPLIDVNQNTAVVSWDAAIMSIALGQISAKLAAAGGVGSRRLAPGPSLAGSLPHMAGGAAHALRAPSTLRLVERAGRSQSPERVALAG
jgi:hypothetical protein